MCDCYWPECNKKRCTERIPTHIADYNYPQEAVEVFCNKHLPKKRVTIFELIKKPQYSDDGEECFEVGWKGGIRLRKGKIEPNSVGVYPNSGADFKITILE